MLRSTLFYHVREDLQIDLDEREEFLRVNECLLCFMAVLVGINKETITFRYLRPLQSKLFNGIF